MADGESFQDQHEQFELVAVLGGCGKPVNLTTKPIVLTVQ